MTVLSMSSSPLVLDLRVSRVLNYSPFLPWLPSYSFKLQASSSSWKIGGGGILIGSFSNLRDSLLLSILNILILSDKIIIIAIAKGGLLNGESISNGIRQV